MKKTMGLIFVFVSVLLLLFMVDPAFANRLVDAAERGTSTVTQIVRAGSSLGVLVGAGLMAFGMGNTGKMVLSGSVVGVFFSFGGKAIIELISGLF